MDPNKTATTVQPPKKVTPGNLKWIVLCVVALLIVGILGYVIGFTRTNTKTSSMPSPTPLASSIFDKQTASIEGKVISISSDNLTVLDNSSSKSTVFKVAKDFLVYLPDPKTNESSVSAGVKSIILNQTALIELELIGGEYQVISITYVPQTAP